MNVFIDWQNDVPPTEEEEKYIRDMVLTSKQYEAAESEGKRLFTISVSADQIKVIKRAITKNKKRTGAYK